MRLHINHTTRYSYNEPVIYGLQQIRLTPTDSVQQRVLNWSVDIEGGRVELSYSDQFQNHTLLAQVEAGQSEVVVTAKGEVETSDTAGVFGQIYGAVPLWHFVQSTPRTEAGKSVRKLAKIVGSTDSMLNDLHTLSREILAEAPYNKSSTFVDTTAEQALIAGGGVCQDHAQIFISAARYSGVPARYVSGYLMMNGQIDQDASHAWAEAHVDGIGWVGFDVSNGISPDDRYVRLVSGLDSSDTSPISGMRQGATDEAMMVSLQVQQ